MPAVPMLAPPNGELVTQAWIAKYTTISAAQIAGSLAAQSKWTNNAFLTVRMLPAGVPSVELTEKRGTICQIDAWAATPTSTRPLWGTAMTLLERVRAATFRDSQTYGRPIDMPVSGYRTARVLSAYLVTEPIRVENDPSAFAHMTCDLAVDWTV